MIAGLGILGSAILGVFMAIFTYGYENVKDTVFQYPTKLMMNGTWIESQYGTPPILISTPDVLVRKADSPKGFTIFRSGDPLKSFLCS